MQQQQQETCRITDAVMGTPASRFTPEGTVRAETPTVNVTGTTTAMELRYMSRWLTGYDKAVNGGVSKHTLPLLVCCGIENDSGEAHAGSEEQVCEPDN